MAPVAVHCLYHEANQSGNIASVTHRSGRVKARSLANIVRTGWQDFIHSRWKPPVTSLHHSYRQIPAAPWVGSPCLPRNPTLLTPQRKWTGANIAWQHNIIKRVFFFVFIRFEFEPAKKTLTLCNCEYHMVRWPVVLSMYVSWSR